MSELSTYSFLPWLRNGAANNILEEDKDNSVLIRAKLNVRLSIAAGNVDGTNKGDSINKDLELYGPGDIVGIDSKVIIKSDPHHWITNFEPNYLPYIDFYDEDFPWRYTPAKTSGQRLRPWIALVVLKPEEFTEKGKGDTQPLPSFELKGVTAANVFPDPEQLWAWAHVHVNKDIGNGTDLSNPTALNNLTNLLKQDPDFAFSRIVSPRKLEESAAYHAFLIPVFESGRLAGIGDTIPAVTVATASAWANNQTIFPYYHRWYFRTGAKGDFEYLVNLLKPQPTDKRVGVREMDLLHPGSNLPPIQEPEDINGILKLGGALKVPFDTLPQDVKEEVTKYDTWDEHPYPHEFQKKMAALVNLADDYENKSALQANTDANIQTETDVFDPDPIITMPLYARWHALVNRLLVKKDGTAVPNTTNWVHELNLDPRFRVPAGTGTKVIQKNQEAYMDAAWQQVGDVIDANYKIRFGELSKEVSFYFHQKHLKKLATTRLLSITAPLQKRVITEGLTLYYAMEQSKVPAVMTSTVFRKVTRSQGPVAKRIIKTNIKRETPLHPASVVLKNKNWIEQVNNGALIIAPPKAPPVKGLLLEYAAPSVKPSGISGAIGSFALKNKWFKWLLLVLALILLVFGIITGIIFLYIAAAIAAAGFYFFYKAEKDFLPTLVFDEKNQTPASVATMPARPDFRISDPASPFNPATGTTDSVESTNFKLALRESFSVMSIDFPVTVRPALSLATIPSTILAQLHPDITIPKRILESINIPLRIKDKQKDKGFAPVMHYPEFDIPMYRPLSDLSKELFLPNINLIPENSISLLETNQKFIESYMAGLNHEMARELLWREYPTDQRGSYFRQFWDVSSFYKGNPVPQTIKEDLRDIFPLHQWDVTTNLGTHNKRETGGDAAQLVLVIRGELLKRYPTAVIYAQKAEWDTTNGVNDPNKERKLITLSEAEEADPPTDKLKTPLFEAKVDSDIYFFGFDLTSLQVKGGTQGDQDAGWFFVIKERPGEPRFGLDQPIDAQIPRLINWNNLSWNHLAIADGSCITINQTFTFDPYNALEDRENEPNAQDAQASWNPSTNAAQLAYILYQVPVMVAVHGARMLPKTE